jgi:hypothetical protein
VLLAYAIGATGGMVDLALASPLVGLLAEGGPMLG